MTIKNYTRKIHRILNFLASQRGFNASKNEVNDIGLVLRPVLLVSTCR